LVDIIRGSSGLGDTHLLNIYTEKLTKVMNDLGKIRRWVTDRSGVIRLALANDEEEFSSVFYRAGEKADWVEIERFPADGPTWVPLGFEGDNATLYVRSNRRPRPSTPTTPPPAKSSPRCLPIRCMMPADRRPRYRKKVVGVTCERERPERSG